MQDTVIWSATCALEQSIGRLAGRRLSRVLHTLRTQDRHKTEVCLDSLLGFLNGGYGAGALRKALWPDTEVARGAPNFKLLAKHAMQKPTIYRCEN